jgi:hypothetical protein
MAHRPPDRYLGGLGCKEATRAEITDVSMTKVNSASAALSATAARTIGEILVLADVIDPMTFIAAPFVNRSSSCLGFGKPPSLTYHPPLVFFDRVLLRGGVCFRWRSVHNNSMLTIDEADDKVAEVAVHSSASATPSRPTSPEPSDPGIQHPSSSETPTRLDASRSFLSSVAATNLGVIRQGLARQAIYWSGVSWIEGSRTLYYLPLLFFSLFQKHWWRSNTPVVQKVQGAKDIDLAQVSEAVKSCIVLSDEGVFKRSALKNGP